MWDVDNETPFAHAHTWERDRDGADTWIVVIKGTFDVLDDGSTVLASEQCPVCETPIFHGEPGHSSLRLETDLLRVKPTTDVIVLGHACSPSGRPIERVETGLKIADVEKTLWVWGDREYRREASGIVPGRPMPFVRTPLVYERSFGGQVPHPEGSGSVDWDERNPVGMGYIGSSSKRSGMPVPNIEYPGGRQPEWPAGFGAIAAHWKSRRRWCGTYDEAWERQRKPLVPTDQDDRFYLSAPDDQRPAAHLVGGERVELRGMTPGGVLGFLLPRVVLGFETIFSDIEPVIHRQVLHSVIIEPDVPRVCLVWQTSLACHPRVLKLQFTRVTEKRVLNASR